VSETTITILMAIGITLGIIGLGAGLWRLSNDLLEDWRAGRPDRELYESLRETYHFIVENMLDIDDGQWHLSDNDTYDLHTAIFDLRGARRAT
jgi:nitrogen fixation-related uncharacterized protein